MKIDLPGRIKNTTLPISRSLLPVFEAVVNSIHAIEDVNQRNGVIRVNIHRDKTDQTFEPKEMRASRPIREFSIEDNGIGFDSRNFAAFETSDTQFKRQRGGKGIGRFFWLKAFEEVEVSSSYHEDGENWIRKFRFNIASDGVFDNELDKASSDRRKTSVELKGFYSQYQKSCPNLASTIAEKLLEHCLVYFLNSSCPKIELSDDDEDELIIINDLFEKRVRPNVHEEPLNIEGNEFTIKHIRLYTGEQIHHSIFLCAHYRAVSQINLHSKIPLLRNKLRIGNGKPFVYLAYVTSEFLDERVNSDRTDFNFVKEGELSKNGEITDEKLLESILNSVRSELSYPIEELFGQVKERIEKLVSTSYPEYRSITKEIDTLIEDFPSNISDEELLKKLNEIQFQEDLETREEAKKILARPADDNTRIEEYDRQIRHYLSRVTETRQSRLAQYIIHRKSILDILRKRLELQSDDQYALEEKVHEVIFPLKMDSNELDWGKQNLWIIDEKLAYHHYLASDKPIKSLQPIEADGSERPDLVVFNRPGAFSYTDQPPFTSVVIVEFKRPEREDFPPREKNPAEQVHDYVRKIRSGSVKNTKGRTVQVSDTTPFYCFIICDLVEKIKLIAENAMLTKAPDGMGYFGFNKNLNTYIEFISFDKLLNDAEQRNRVLFKKLGLIPS